jgi:hypothetical protein
MGAPQPPTKDPGWAVTEMVKLGLQYYISGRSAAIAGFNPVAGNLLHHAVEMLLKAQLLKAYSLKEIKTRYGHNLLAAWTDFKGMLPLEDLGHLDQAITDLDVFDDIRYPDLILEKGASMAVSWGQQKPAVTTRGGPTLPEYFLYVNDIDHLVATIFRVSGWNPKFFAFIFFKSEARTALDYQNKNLHSADFLA